MISIIFSCCSGFVTCINIFTSCFVCVRGTSLLECCIGFFAYKKIKSCCSDTNKAMHKCYDDSISSAKNCYHSVFDHSENNESLENGAQLGGAVMTDVNV